ncbi:MAG: CRISPR-associated protein Cas4 [Bacteroidota bacterium]
MPFSLTPSHIIAHLYCPRFTYFEHVLRIPQYEDRHYKVNRGRQVHQQKAIQNSGYLRRRLGVQGKLLNPYLTNDLLRGEVDEVLFLSAEEYAPLDYKFAQFKDRVYGTYKTQLYCYAHLIESNFQKKVSKGFLVYTRSQHRLVEVPIHRRHIDKVKKDAADICDLLAKNHYPKATPYKKRCVTCTYRNICTR